MSPDGKDGKPVSPPRVSVPKVAPSLRPAAPGGPPAIQRSPSLIDSGWLDGGDDDPLTTETSIDVAAYVPETVKNRALLRLVSGIDAGQVFAIEQREMIIGRGRDAHVRVDDGGVSRQHTKFVQTIDGRFFVEDMGSTNGTFVGGRKIDRIELASGDHIHVGPNVVFSFTLIDETEEKLAKQLYESSTRDALTKLFNRKYFVERLASEVGYANRHKSRLSVLIFDLDHFKLVNDTHGHLAGDEVLRQVAAQLSRMIRAEDVIARYGGEEFVTIVRGIEHRNVVLFAERLRRAVEKLEIKWDSIVIRATISIGVASLHECGDQGTSEALLLLADERLYAAKRGGRNRVRS